MWRPARGIRLMVVSSFRLGSVGWLSAGRGRLASAVLLPFLRVTAVERTA
jgi:hypothetical protein